MLNDILASKEKSQLARNLLALFILVVNQDFGLLQRLRPFDEIFMEGFGLVEPPTVFRTKHIGVEMIIRVPGGPVKESRVLHKARSFGIEPGGAGYGRRANLLLVVLI